MNEVNAAARQIAMTSGDLARSMDDLAKTAQSTTLTASNSQTNLDKLTNAAVAVEQNAFQLESLSDVSDRSDELGQLARMFTQMVKTIHTREQELKRLNQSFARFFPSEYLRFLRKETVTDVKLGDYVSKTMAVMFSDIRSFTTISETMTPQENFNFVNAFLKRVSPEIRNHYGIIVKFLGDGMMAVFPEGADDAVAAGIAKQLRVQKYNRRVAL